jgi:hypothetical protein
LLFPEALNTALELFTLIVAVPLAVALKVTVATTCAPVTAGIAPRSMFTVPPPPELDATIPKALELPMLT